METITARIDSIIAARRVSLAKVNAASNNLEKCFVTVKNFERLQAPSAEGSDCIGAKSIVTNNPAVAFTTAKIEFFSQVEMIENVIKWTRCAKKSRRLMPPR